MWPIKKWEQQADADARGRFRFEAMKPDVSSEAAHNFLRGCCSLNELPRKPGSRR